jgi:hypothetical protein
MARLTTFICKLLVVISLVAFSLGSGSRQAAAAPDEADATTIYVALWGSDTPGCGSSSNPCRSLQYAVERSASGGTIFVAAGVYTYQWFDLWPTCFGATITAPVVCIVDKHLTMIGGFHPENWSGPDAALYPTVIDGQNQYRGIGLFGSNQNNLQASLYLSGFTIQNGLAQGKTSGADYEISGYGGGLYATNARLDLHNVVFLNNRAVGGNTTSMNGGAGVGGGLAISSSPPNTSSTLDGIVFSGNQALGGSGRERGGSSLGGGLYTYGANVYAIHLTFTDNIARAGNSNGSGVDGYGLNADGLGGGATVHGLSNVNMYDVFAVGNQAIGGNAGVKGGNGHGGALFTENAYSMNVYGAYLSANTALGGAAQYGGIGGGGAVMTANSGCLLDRVRAIANTALGGTGSLLKGSAGGGGFYFTRFFGASAIVVQNSIIADNYIEQGGGPGDAGGGGAGMWIQGTQVDITHSTLSGNRMEPALIYGLGLAVVDFGTPTPATVTLRNSVISDHQDNTPATWLTQAAVHVFTSDDGGSENVVTLDHTAFANNDNDTNAENDPPPPMGPGDPKYKPGQINFDSVFNYSTAGYLAPGAPNYNYHIGLASPLSDEADGILLTTDIDAASRPYNANADLGADEYAPFSVMAVPGNQSIRLDWTQDAGLILAGIDAYEVLVQCAQGARPPNEGACNRPIVVAGKTELILTGLTDSQPYTLIVSARDSHGTVVASSLGVTMTPANNFILAPLMIR